ncbi:MAG: ComEC/Rec2 family competence protein [Planctomycetota bacterium]
MSRPHSQIPSLHSPAPGWLLPGPLRIAALLILGIRLADAFAWQPGSCLALASGCLLLAAPLRPLSATTALVLLHGALLAVGASLWSVRSATQDGRDLALLLQDRPGWTQSSVRLCGTLSCIPALDTVRDSAGTSFSNSRPRTAFLLQATELLAGTQPLPVRGLCRVWVDGDATNQVRWGDAVELIGRLSLPEGPRNPGEFDYALYLRRTGISAQVYLRHPAAIQVRQHAGPWSIRSLLNSFRQQTVRQLQRCLSPDNRATAEALLLGNRGRMETHLEDDFVFSGTMHLLAISGLHVGILYVFILRLLHLILVPRSRALLLAATVCMLYACLTDLRPSVLRAALFIVFSAAGQFCCRDIRMGPLIGLTAIVLAICDPSVAFDIGAWLSFLAVGALGWVAERTPAPAERPVPADVPGWRDRCIDFLTSFSHWLLHSYRQMFAVTLLSAPLIAHQFHLLSITGLVVNLALVPFTTLTLATGYFFVASALLLPMLAPAASLPFDACLSLMNHSVALSADFRMGYLMIPDLPNWFLPVWYGTLAASTLSSTPARRHALRLFLMLLTAHQLSAAGTIPDRPGLNCTALSVGHGNAIVVETAQKVILFDAGAMHRPGRTASTIAAFLWHRGYRMIDAIVLSHPDADHYNATAGLIDRFPVGQIITTQQFVDSPSHEVQQLLQRLRKMQIPVIIAHHEDSIRLESLDLQFLQATPAQTNSGSSSSAPPPEHSPGTDNEFSLTAVLRFAGHQLCFPGDLEGPGQHQLLPLLPACSLLVSPHHGSPPANTPELAAVTQPATLFVSARDDRHLHRLKTTFPGSRILHTSTSGAISMSVSPEGQVRFSRFLATTASPPLSP